jgi:hypothetical protein
LPLRAAATILAAIMALTFPGCLGSPVLYEVNKPGRVFTQEGGATLPARCEQDVYYPVAFASPPNLEIEDDGLFQRCEIIEQRADRFRVWNPTFLSRSLSWTARGVQCAPAVPPPPPSDPLVPDEPVPAGAPKVGFAPAQLAQPKPGG